MSPLHGPALVTGAAGFIGGHLFQRLLDEGVAAKGLDRAPARRALPDGARVIEGDIRDPDATRRAIADTRPEVIYHLAAQTSVSVSMREPAADVEANVLGTVHVAQAAAAAGVRRLVFFSTGGALFGAPDRIPVNERTPAAPLSIYGTSKLSAERYLALLGAASGLEVSVVRPGNVYGPWQDPHGEAGVVAIFGRRMLAGEPVTIYGDGGQRRDYVYAEDVVEAALLAATLAPATCLVGTGVATSTREVFDALARACGYEAQPVLAPERPGDIPQIALDSTRAKQLWGWEPRVPFEVGVQRTVEWFRSQPV